MTRCQVCQRRDAVIHLTRIHQGDVEQIRLCAECAAERGISVEITMTPAEPDPLFADPSGLGLAGDPSGAACPRCGATVASIDAARRLGCAGCWEMFAPVLRPLLQRMQGAVQHSGKAYVWLEDEAERALARAAHHRESLERALRLAVAEERFEDAARVRDQLREVGP